MSVVLATLLVTLGLGAQVGAPSREELELAPGRYVLGPIHLGTAARGH